MPLGIRPWGPGERKGVAVNRRIARALVLVLVLSGSTSAIGAPPARALSSNPDPIKSRVNGKVYAQVHSGNLIYMAGNFTKVVDQNGDRHPAGSIAAFDVSTGDWDPSFLPIVGGDLHLKVSALAISPDGATLYAGGDFDSINGSDVKNLAAIDLATGQVEAGFAPTPGGSVEALLAGPDLLYMGGSFSHVDGKRRRHLAALGYDGTLSNAWRPYTQGGACPPPYQDPDRCTDGGTGAVRSLAFSPDHSMIYIGGSYYYVNGEPRNCLSRVSAADGTLDAWAVPFGEIFGDPQDHKPGPNMAWAMVVTDTRLYVGFGRIPNYMQAFHLDEGDVGETAWKKSGMAGNVESVALSPDGSRLFAGGHFGTAKLDFQLNPCGGAWVHGMISVDPATGSYNCDWIPTIKPFGGTNAPGSGIDPPNFTGAWDMLVVGDALWVGGYMTSINDQKVGGFARFTI
jgi:Domain of unknown function (DUF5122) beta-propeller